MNYILFDQTTYEKYLDSSDTVLLMLSPISLYPGIIDIHGSTFSEYANSLNGGVIYSNLNSIVILDFLLLLKIEQVKEERCILVKLN